MFNDDYGSLKDAIADWLARTDLDPGFTKKTGTITGVTTASGNALFASTAHGLAAGDVIYITLTIDHNGKKTVTSTGLTADAFQVGDSYVQNQKGEFETWQSGIPEFVHLAELNIQQKLNFVPNQNDLYTSSATMTADQDYIYAPVGCIEPIHLRLETSPVRELDVVAMRELIRIGRTNTSGIPSAMAPAGSMRSGTITSIATALAGSAIEISSSAHSLATGDIIRISNTSSYDGFHSVLTSTPATGKFVVVTPYQGSSTGKWESYQPRILFDVAPSTAYDYTLFYRARFDYLKDRSNTSTSWLLANFGNLLFYGSLLEASPYIKDDERIVVWGSRFEDSLSACKRQQWRRRMGGGELRVRADVSCP